MNQRQFELFKKKGNRVGDLVVKRQRIDNEEHGNVVS